jgi:hypothetical protein
LALDLSEQVGEAAVVGIPAFSDVLDRLLGEIAPAR